jgi:hypothetical protein
MARRGADPAEEERPSGEQGALTLSHTTKSEIFSSQVSTGLCFLLPPSVLFRTGVKWSLSSASTVPPPVAAAAAAAGCSLAIMVVERRQRRNPLVLASTQVLLDSLPGDRPPPPPQEPLGLRAGVLRFPSGGGGDSEFGELASFVALPEPALRRLAVVTGTPVRRPLISIPPRDAIHLLRIGGRSWDIRSARVLFQETTLGCFREEIGSRGIWLLIERRNINFDHELDGIGDRC